jgi:hypothetical protein
MTDIAGGPSILRTFFIHLAPLIASAEFVQQNAVRRISQVALNYRNSPLSEDLFGDGSLVAGDRIPDLEIRTATPSAEGAPIGAQKMFSLLNPSRFTLLLANFADATAIRAKLSQSNSPWPQLPWPEIPWLQNIDVFEISAPAGEAGKPFTECFGVKPSITLVRPDAYIGFRGTETSVEAFTKYCNQWFAPTEQKQAA